MRKEDSELTILGPNFGCPQVVLDLKGRKGLDLSYLWGPQKMGCTKDLLRKRSPIGNFLSHVAYFIMVLKK